MKSNLWLKVAAFALAVFMWAFVALRESTVSMDAPIEFTGLSPEVEASETESTTHVTLTVKGPERLLKELKAGDIHVSLDLRGARPGVQRKSAESLVVELPPLIKLVGITPATISIRLEEKR